MNNAARFMGLVMMFVFGFVTIGHAASLDDSKALGKQAAAFAKANGREKAIAEMMNPKGKFVKGGLYVVLQDTRGVVLANPMDPGRVGTHDLELKDVDGKPFIKEMIGIVKSKGSGWITYKWTNPATKKIQLKKSWVQQVEGTDMYTLCGVFQ
ncbi:MAG: cache domain-containing protein [Deltaproteobacteria bacterium]|nr:cache domain-containing protein [Deltaproteobacteria bacterium]